MKRAENGTCKFRTLVKKDHKLGENELVLGKIIGYKELMCDNIIEDNDKLLYGVALTKYGRMIATECTPEEYDRFAKVVEMRYPELCEFNWTAD